MSAFLDYVVSIQESIPTPEVTPSFINKAYFVCAAVAEYEGDLPFVVEIFTPEDAAQYTDDGDVSGFFKGGLSSLTLVVIDTADLSVLSDAGLDSKTCFNMVLSKDIAIADYVALNLDYDGIVGYAINDQEADSQYLSTAKYAGYYSADQASGYIAFCEAFGVQLSQSNYTNLQYIQSSYSNIGAVTEKGEAENSFNSRACFYFFSIEYGNRLSGWFAGGKPLTYWLINEEIKFNLQQYAFTWTADNQPTDTAQNRLAIQNYLNKKVIVTYVDIGYLSSDAKNTIVVKDSTEIYFNDIDAKYVIPNPIWRYNLIISQAD